MQFLMIVLYILLFIVLLSVLIIVHELGHLVAAKAFNVYCLEYSIGMGPLLFKKKRKNGETQFSVRAIPFGGYVSMYGEGVELPEGVEVDESRSLNKIKAWKRAIVLLAGVTMNAILALVFFFVSNCVSEAPYINCLVVNNNTAISEVAPNKQVVFDMEYAEFVDEVAQVKRQYYVFDKNAHLNGDDTVDYVAIFDYSTMESYKDLDLAQFLYIYPYTAEGKYDFTSLVSPTTIEYVNVHFHSITGRNEDGSAIYGDVYEAKVTQKDGKYESFGCSMYFGRKNETFGAIIKGTFGDFGRCSVALFKAIGSLFTDIASWNDVGGIVAVGFQTTSTLQNFGIGMFLFYWGFISVNLAIFNLLPFPGLDGWQLLVLIVEGATRKKIPEKVKNIVSFVGLALLLLLMVVIVGKDVYQYIIKGIFNKQL